MTVGSGEIDTIRSRPGTFAPLAIPLFRRIWGGVVASNVGTFLHLTAVPWMMNELTGSPLMVSLVTASVTLPRLLFTLPSGMLADIVDRRTIMLLGNGFGAAAATTMAVLAATGRMTPGFLLALTFLLGSGHAVTLPAQQTLVPDLVDASLRAHAITLNAGAFNVARAVGPSIGGLLVAGGLTGAAFGLNAASFVLVVSVLLTVPRQRVEGLSTSMLQSVGVGLRYVRFTRPILQLVAVTAMFMMTAISVQSLMPNVASDELQVGSTGFGLLYGLFGLGALFAVAVRDRVARRFPRRMLPGSILVFGVGGVVLGFAESAAVACIAVAVAGIGWVSTLVTLNATVQTLAPRWVRSRVVAVYLLAIGVQPFGAALAGVLAEFVGPGNAIAILNTVTVILGLVLLRLDLPVLNEIAEPVPASYSPAQPHGTRQVGGPVVVANTWHIDPEQLDEFLGLVWRLRRVRMRSGASGWSVYHDVDHPNRITEVMILAGWDEHLAQHDRLDHEAVQLLLRARGFDQRGEPSTIHWATLDLNGRDASSSADRLLGQHAELHSIHSPQTASGIDSLPKG